MYKLLQQLKNQCLTENAENGFSSCNDIGNIFT